MPISVSSDALTTPATNIIKTQYFNVELRCVNMVPNTQYDAYVDGAKVNAFCKPFGGNLGDPLLSGPDGTLVLQYHMGISYVQKYVTKPNTPLQPQLVNKPKMITFVDPKGRMSTTYLPVTMKVS